MPFVYYRYTESKYLNSEERSEEVITASDIMSTDLITLAPNMDIVSAAKILLDNRINGAPVLDESERLIGILCQSDLIAQQKKLPIPTLFTLLDSVIQMTSTKKIQKEIKKIAALKVADAMIDQGLV